MSRAGARGGWKVRGRSVLVGSIEVALASGMDDFEQALLLLAEAYRARGYEEAGTKLFRFTPFHALPGTITVVARDGPRVVATLSVVPDTALLGLPMEPAFAAEVARLRSDGRRLAEVTGLAHSGLSPRDFLTTFDAMIALALQSHAARGGDSWLMAVHPRHAGYYVRGLRAEPIGPVRSLPTVQDAPAQALLVDRQVMMKHVPERERLLFDPLPAEILAPPERPADHSSFFGAFSTAAEPDSIRAVERAVQAGAGVPRWLATAA